MQHPNRKDALVSVIVMTYNHGPYIEECLESLANQDCDFPFEILVGEDCSTDDTRKRVLKVSDKYPDLIRPILSELNLGANKNSLNLTNLAVGKYIAICEGDDYWHRSDKLRRQVEILESDSGVALVCTDADAYFHNTGKRIRSIHERNGQWNNPPEDVALALLTRKIYIFTCSVCIPNELLLGSWEDNPYERPSAMAGNQPSRQDRPHPGIPRELPGYYGVRFEIFKLHEDFQVPAISTSAFRALCRQIWLRAGCPTSSPNDASLGNDRLGNETSGRCAS